MKTIVNVSNVTDYSGEPPVAVYSNPVTTVIRTPAPPPIRIRYFYDLPCVCCCRCHRCDCCRRDDNC